MSFVKYRHIKWSARCDDEIAPELHRMAKTLATQMKDTKISGKDSISVIVFLQDFKLACDACEREEGVALWLFKQ